MPRRKKIVKRKVRDVTPAVVVLLSVMIIFVSTISSYFFITDNKEQLEKLKEAKANKELRKIELEESKKKLLLVSRLVGWRQERPWGEPQGGWTNPESIKLDENNVITAGLRASLNNWVKFLKDTYGIEKYDLWPEIEGERKDTKKQRLHILKLIDELEQRTVANHKLIEELIPPRDKARQDEAFLTGTWDERKQLKNPGEIFNKEIEKIEEIKPLRGQISEISVRINELINEQEQTLSQSTIEMWHKAEELATMIRQNEAEIAQLEQELAEYQDRLEKVTQRLELEKEGIEIDGEIILADMANGYAYIDLGRIHGLLVEGMDFEVFRIEKGGFKQTKGRVKVIKIYEDYSQVAIFETAPDAFITKGDYVNCIVYNPKRAKIFVIAGRPIGRYSLAELKERIEKAGGKVLDEVTPDISYVVIGEGFKTDPKYIKATHLGAVTIREKELYFFLKLEWK